MYPVPQVGEKVEVIPERDRMGIFAHPNRGFGPFTVVSAVEPWDPHETYFCGYRLIVKDASGKVLTNVGDSNPATIHNWYFRKAS